MTFFWRVVAVDFIATGATLALMALGAAVYWAVRRYRLSSEDRLVRKVLKEHMRDVRDGLADLQKPWPGNEGSGGR
jgi:hypothetical protein